MFSSDGPGTVFQAESDIFKLAYNRMRSTSHFPFTPHFKGQNRGKDEFAINAARRSPRSSYRPITEQVTQANANPQITFDFEKPTEAHNYSEADKSRQNHEDATE